MHDWLAMGGYAMYVWPAYAVFFLVLIIDWFAPLLRRRHLLNELRGRAAREQLRRQKAARQEGAT